MSALLRSARPHQWLKNILVVAAPGAAGVLDDPAAVGRTALVFVAFCLASSGTYYWNDVLDVDSDRTHPVKSRRPIAAGLVSLRTARLVGTLLLVSGLLAAVGTGRWRAVIAVAVYIVVTTSYSAIWKHIAVIDLVAIASGFVLRAAGGAWAVGVAMSGWFVLVTTFGALFIVTGKRYAEARELGDGAGSVRATLAEYSEEFLRFVLSVTCGGALVSYCVWAFEARDLAGSEMPWYELSIVPMVTAFFRYALVLDQGHGAAPEEVFRNDRALQILGLVWVIVFGVAVYT